ncbi:helix-turn-helix domain-containing protein [Haloarcula sp. S1CR25-12]|uniref:Helix-turn-helix domain-containing protein n=1 Tax=Haloarcula saliterrae TaxID=2950534 RepID=A0ABU2F6P9_9EURY|nr:helix-turn-helix domain-containing protein [Haloarcula sp. S1CR25-12]MDS0257955.1 helix-turn-helix domain-containing protein [Haloarcula sp. S1CR25-12]
MATLAEFALPPETFPVGVVFEEFPEATIELGRVVPVREELRPYCWVMNVAGDAVQRFLELETAIEQPKIVDTVGDHTLFRYQSPRTRDGLLAALADTDVTLLSATGTREGWLIHVQSDRQRAIAAFDDQCRQAGIRLTLRDIHKVTAPSERSHPAVTDAQREALLLAYEHGYYSEPRETTLDELADRVGISRQAFASRLRRGYRTLIESHLKYGSGLERVT